MAGDTKLVWVASMTRSGSMWVYNVARSLLRYAGKRVLPEDVPQGDPEMMTEAVHGLEDPNPKNVWVLKVHALVRADTPRSRFLVTHRDPRDALVSYMRFMKCDFEAALQVMVNSTRACDYFRALPTASTLHLEYHDIVNRPEPVARQIGAHLGLSLSQPAVSAVVSRFSKEEVRRRIDEVETAVRGRTASGHAVAPEEIVQVSPGHLRIFDLHTGFQSGHVSDYLDGEWRTHLTYAQQRRVAAVLGPWLARSTYSLSS